MTPQLNASCPSPLAARMGLVNRTISANISNISQYSNISQCQQYQSISVNISQYQSISAISDNISKSPVSDWRENKPYGARGMLSYLEYNFHVGSLSSRETGRYGHLLHRVGF